MKSVTTFCILFFSLNLSFSQQMPLEFEDNPADTFQAFLNSGFSFNSDPQVSNNDVGQFFNDGSEVSQGFYIDLQNPIDLNIQQIITLRFYSFDPNNHSILLKLENGDDIDVEVREAFSVPSPSDWITLTFDFSNAQNSNNGNPINANGTYSRLTIFIDEGQNIPGTYLIDDIDDGTIPPDPNAIDVIYDVLVWEDTFDSGSTPVSIDSNNWFHQTYAPQFNPDFGGNAWFNGELQHYTDRMDNSYLQNGELNIILKREDYTPPSQANAASLKYTSARLNSKFSFTYGRVDVKAKLPGRLASWPAIWTLGTNIAEEGGFWYQPGVTNAIWPACGEIDVMEHGLHADNTTSSAIHVPGRSGGNPFSDTIGLIDVVNDYHIYSANWSPNKIVFLVDDIPYYSVTKEQMEAQGGTWVFDLDQYLLLNVAVGGFAGTPDDDDFNDSAMIIDYVKVYQNSTLSLDDNFESKFVISPNPATDFINISTKESIDSIELYNVLGQQVMKQKGKGRIDISNMQRGIFILKIYSNKSVVSKKIVVN